MRDDMLTAELERAVRVLQEDVPPNDIWRQQLLHRLGDRETAAAPKSWTIRPWVALVAGVGCMAVGAVTAVVVTRAEQPPRVAAAPAAPRVRFTLVAPGATTVSIVGDFNGWTEGALPLKRSADGRTWEIDVPLAPGRYAYAFVVDGRIARDPSAPLATGDDFGSPSSVVMVKGS